MHFLKENKTWKYPSWQKVKSLPTLPQYSEKKLVPNYIKSEASRTCSTGKNKENFT